MYNIVSYRLFYTRNQHSYVYQLRSVPRHLPIIVMEASTIFKWYLKHFFNADYDIIFNPVFTFQRVLLLCHHYFCSIQYN